MGIDVAIVGGQNEKIQHLFDTKHHLTAMALGPWQQMMASHCVRFIDPWGDALFNQAQLPELLAELEQSRSLVTDEDVIGHLEKVCGLVREAQREGVHVYVKFIGE